MSFQPFVPGAGLSGWVLLNATLSAQKSTFNQSVPIRSDTQYFLERFETIETAKDLVNDRRILRVALGAYGLSEDIDNRYFIQTMLEQGVGSSTALANRLADRRYRSFVADFDFSSHPPRHKVTAGLAQKTVAAFRDQAFDQKIGEISPDMRLALGFGRGMSDLVAKAATNATAWYQVLATPPLRTVVQTALGLPDAFSQLDIDDQHQRIQRKAERVFGSSDLQHLTSGDQLAEITRRFLVLKEATAVPAQSSLHTSLFLLRAQADAQFAGASQRLF